MTWLEESPGTWIATAYEPGRGRYEVARLTTPGGIDRAPGDRRRRWQVGRLRGIARDLPTAVTAASDAWRRMNSHRRAA